MTTNNSLTSYLKMLSSACETSTESNFRFRRVKSHFRQVRHVLLTLYYLVQNRDGILRLLGNYSPIALYTV